MKPYEGDTVNKYLSDQRRLWSLVANSGEDIITASGWKDTINKKPFSQEEMDEFTNNVFVKLKPRCLGKEDCSVLEIGVGSGQILHKIAPCVSNYDAVDISSEVLDACRKFLPDEYCNIRFFQLFAHEIDSLDRSYDIIILNSVMQYFADEDYVYDVLKKCRGKLRHGGVIFCGDIMDADRKKELISYVSSQNHSRNNYGKLLFYSRSFFYDIAKRLNYSRCETTDKIYTIQNELSLFRYDAILFAD